MTDLAGLMEDARVAAPDRRIDLRDPIAAHGEPAIEMVGPWLADALLAAFAVRVIEKVGLDGHGDAAASALRRARKRVPAVVSGDVEAALARLRTAARPPKVGPVPRPTRAPRREAPHGSLPGRRPSP